MGARYEYDETINYIVLAERGIDTLYDIICKLQDQVKELEDINKDLLLENTSLDKRLFDAQNKIDELEEKNEVLRKDVARLSENY